MVIGLVGYKRGMTSVFLENSDVVPVTVVEFLDNFVIQKKIYNNFFCIQISTGLKKNLNKPEIGHIKLAGIYKSSGLWSFKYPVSNFFNEIKIGDSLRLNIFSNVTKVDVVGFSIGRGFSGVIKRHGFHRQPTSHGNSRSHRVPGSIGQRQTPGRVFKGKKMPGRFGCSCVTVKNLSIVNVDYERNILLIKGSVPGFVNSILIVKQSFREFFIQQRNFIK